MPIPGDTSQFVDAIFEGLLLKENAHFGAQLLPILDEYLKPRQAELELTWENAADQERRTRTLFAQSSIKVEEVAGELAAARDAIGSDVDVEDFLRDVVRVHGGAVSEARDDSGRVTVDLTEVPRGLREMVSIAKFTARFSLPTQEGELYLTRTHPMVETLASYVMDTALDPVEGSQARRCGAIRTRAVTRRTTLLIVRLRFQLLTQSGDTDTPLMAEDCCLLAFAGAPDAAEWLDEAEAKRLLTAAPDANIAPEQAADFVRRVVNGYAFIAPRLELLAQERASALLEAHQRVRQASKVRGIRHSIEVQLPPDVLGIYVYLPALVH